MSDKRPDIDIKRLTCEWDQHDLDGWVTECGRRRAVRMPKARFCAFCGRLIVTRNDT